MTYRLLIVDDEPFILNWLAQLFLMQDTYDIDIYRAGNAKEALDSLQKHRIDVVLCDIMMPGMNGLDFSKIVLQKWNSCKFIFLTAYGKFEYVYDAIDCGAIDFVLKTENDERIFGAVEKAIKMIQRESESLELLKKTEESLRTVAPFMQNMLWSNCFAAEEVDTTALSAQLKELSIRFDASNSFYLMLMRLDEISVQQIMKVNDNFKEYMFIGSVLEKKLGGQFNCASFMLQTTENIEKKRRICFLLQPKDGTGFIGAEKEAGDYLEKYLDDIQNTIISALDTQVSIVLSTSLVNFTSWKQRYSVLKTILQMHMSEDNVILTDKNPHTIPISTVIQTELKPVKLERLKENLLSGNAKNCHEIIDKYQQICLENDSQLPELYTTMTVLISVIADKFSFKNLFLKDFKSYEQFSNEDEVFAYVNARIDDLCREVIGSNQNTEKNIVSQIKNYVHANLSGDLSLDAIGEALFYNSTYISRLFNKATGINLSDYIKRVKLDKIKELLRNRDLKIKDISQMTGFESTNYFCRFFKKESGISAQAYREKL